MKRTWTAALAGGAMVVALLGGTQAGATADGGGTTRWSESFLAGAPAWSSDVATSPDGSTVFVTGTTQWYPQGRMTTLAYDADSGVRRWVRTVGTDDPSAQGVGEALDVSPDGSMVLVAGDACSDCQATGHLWTVTAYDAATGDQVWVRHRTTELAVRSMTISPDGETAYVSSADGLTGSITALDVGTGAVRWNLDQDDYNDFPDVMAVSPDSTTLYFGANAQLLRPCGSGGALSITAYDTADGSTRWSSADLDPSQRPCGIVGALALSGDGTTLAATALLDDGGQHDGRYPVAMVVYDASTGALHTVVGLDDMAMLAGTRASVTLSGDGATAVVLGSRFGRADQPLVLTAVDVASGDRPWSSTYDVGGTAYPVDVGLSADGTTAYVSGTTVVECGTDCPDEQYDAPIVAYDTSTGAERWVSHHRGDQASAMSVGAASSGVFLAGTFTAADYSGRARALSRRAGCATYCGFSTSATNVRNGRARLEELGATTIGRWRSFVRRDASSGAFRASRTAGDTVTFRTPAVASVGWVTHTGRAMGRARVLVDGHDHGVVDLFSATAARRTVVLDGLTSRAHVVTVRVLGTRSAHSAGTWVPVDAFTVHKGLRMREESSPDLRYDGWSGARRSGSSGGQVRMSSDPQAGMSLRFRGRSVRWVTATGPGFGKARVVVDGVGRTVDLYRARRHWQVPVAFTDLGAGMHTITVRPVGRKDPRSSSRTIVSDAFDVRP